MLSEHFRGRPSEHYSKVAVRHLAMPYLLLVMQVHIVNMMQLPIIYPSVFHDEALDVALSLIVPVVEVPERAKICFVSSMAGDEQAKEHDCQS